MREWKLVKYILKSDFSLLFHYSSSVLTEQWWRVWGGGCNQCQRRGNKDQKTSGKVEDCFFSFSSLFQPNQCLGRRKQSFTCAHWSNPPDSRTTTRLWLRLSCHSLTQESDAGFILQSPQHGHISDYMQRRIPARLLFTHPVEKLTAMKTSVVGTGHPPPSPPPPSTAPPEARGINLPTNPKYRPPITKCTNASITGARVQPVLRCRPTRKPTHAHTHSLTRNVTRVRVIPAVIYEHQIHFNVLGIICKAPGMGCVLLFGCLWWCRSEAAPSRTLLSGRARVRALKCVCA